MTSAVGAQADPRRATRVDSTAAARARPDTRATRVDSTDAATVRPDTVVTLDTTADRAAIAAGLDVPWVRRAVRDAIAEERRRRSYGSSSSQPSGAMAPLTGSEIDAIASAIDQRLANRLATRDVDAALERVTGRDARIPARARDGRVGVVEQGKPAGSPLSVTLAASDRTLADALADSLRSLERERLSLERERRTADVARLTAETERLRARADSIARAARDVSSQSAARAARADRERYDALRRLDRLVADVANIRETSRGLTITLGHGLFAVGQRVLSRRAVDEMESIAGVLALYPDARLAVEGHTDATGAERMNLALSIDRANAVRQSLAARGIDPARMEVAGFGESRPIAENTTSDGRATNRRVEIVVLDAHRPAEAPLRP